MGVQVMYILKVETLEVGTKEELKSKFKKLKERIETKNSCIESMTLFDNRTGEIEDEYPRL